MRIAVIGASGGMGSFFVRYFLARGDSVTGSDSAAGPASGASGLTPYRTNSEAVRGCDVTILAVPIDSTLAIAKEVLPNLKPGSTLVEMTSVKGKTFLALRRLVGRRVRLLSIHPLFGPALESTYGMKVAVVTGGKGGSDASLARSLFPDARVILMGAKEHDRAMAAVLSLTHLVNIVYAGTLAELISPEEFMRVSTPNSSMQLTLAEAVLAQDPRLSYAIQASNPYSKKAARAASQELKRVLGMVERSDWKAFREHLTRLSKTYQTERRGKAVIKEVYSAAEKSG